MIRRATSPAKVRSFLTYDLEWYPDTMKLRLVGVYDGDAYRYYQTIDAFLDAEMTSDNRGKWFYAHAGGLADIQFVLERIIDMPEYEVDCKFSGSSAVIVKVKRGKNCWYFVDSYWLLRAPLRDIAKWIGQEKGGSEGGTELFFAPLTQLIPYNENDCVILWDAINQFQITLLEIGGQLQMTLAASALMLFRRKFLKDDIQTSRKVNEIAWGAYNASRVEPFRRKMGRCKLYDINSSFPYAMTKPLPAGVKRSSKRIPTGPGALYMALCDVMVPDMYLPPLPYRPAEGGRVYFPIGRWREWFMNEDLELLERVGGRIEAVHEVIEFHAFDGLADYANTLYNARKLTEEGTMENMAWKLLLNSCYGKLAEGNTKQSIKINPANTRCTHKPGCVSYGPEGDVLQDACMELMMPGVFMVTAEQHIPHQWVPVPAAVTAIARRVLYDYISLCQDPVNPAYLDVGYTDTDSIVTACELPTSTDLGALKLESRFKSFRVLQPKVYSAEFEQADKKGRTRKVKAKGFSRMDANAFDLIEEGWSLGIERMTRVKEIFRNETVKPGSRQYSKRVQESDRMKRRMLANGYSRPWHVDELTGIKSKGRKIDLDDDDDGDG